MLKKIFAVILCFGIVALFSPAADFSFAKDAPKCGCSKDGKCTCPADCKCEHCSAAKAGKGCACGADCKCEHCKTGKGECKCGKAEKGCKCGKDCGCEHCKTGKGECSCKTGKGCACGHCKDGKGCKCGKDGKGCACGADCKCEHCKTGKGECTCKEGKDCKCAKDGKGCGCGADCKCKHCKTGKGKCNCKKSKKGCEPRDDKASADAAAAANSAETAAKLFKVSYKTDPADVKVNTMQKWTVSVQDADGKPVKNAEIAVDGSMPAHGHGMPTQPKVTKNLGDGSYIVEGIKFSMLGDWVMKFTIKADSKTDSVSFKVAVK